VNGIAEADGPGKNWWNCSFAFLNAQERQFFEAWDFEHGEKYRTSNGRQKGKGAVL
jgi:hypothetical protein